MKVLKVLKISKARPARPQARWGLDAAAWIPGVCSLFTIWQKKKKKNLFSNLYSTVTSIQKYSTVPPSIFLALHLTNTSLIPLLTRSVPASEPYLLLTRELYQAPVLEDLLLTVPILAHIGSGIALRCLRQARHARRYGATTKEDQQQQRKAVQLSSSSSSSWWKWKPKLPSVQARLGYALAPLLGLHALVNRGVPVYVDGGSSSVGLGYVAHGFARAPWLMTGYYVALVGVGVWHVVGGWAWWTTGWTTEQTRGSGSGSGSASSSGSPAGSEALRRRKRVRRMVNGLVVAGTTLWLAGGLGIVARGGWGAGWEAKSWEAIYSRVPLLGRYLVSGSR